MNNQKGARRRCVRQMQSASLIIRTEQRNNQFEKQTKQCSTVVDMSCFLIKTVSFLFHQSGGLYSPVCKGLFYDGQQQYFQFGQNKVETENRFLPSRIPHFH